MPTTTSPIRSDRVAALPPYLFVDIDRKRRARIAAGADVINLGIGDPDRPTPGFIVEALQKAAADPVHHRYPDGRGSDAFRQAAARFMQKRFGVTADPGRHICAIIGSKEAVFHLPLAVLNPGDGVLVPSPGYPVYHSGAIFASAEPIELPLKPELGWQPDLQEVSQQDRSRARLMWTNYPNNPTAACVEPEFFTRALRFCDDNDIVCASDQAYSEIYFDEAAAPPSLWQAEGADLDNSPAIELHSLSKTFNMTGWRLGFAVGRPDIIDALAAVKSNADSGPFGAVQDAGIAALDGYDRPEVAAMRDVYRARRDALIPALRAIGCEVEPPAAGFFVWARCPKGADGQPMDSMAFATRTLEEADVVVVPGAGFSPHTDTWFRIALTVEVDRMAEAADRLRRVWGGGARRIENRDWNREQRTENGEQRCEPEQIGAKPESAAADPSLFSILYSLLASPPMTDTERTITCMEVWGGNQPADRGVVMPGLTAFVYSHPVGGEAGGDVHYVSSCATGRITRMLVADVAGHGAQVAGVADTLRNLMRRYINYLDQSSFVRALNDEFGALQREGSFATAICLTYWAPTRVMTLCNAGHPRPLFYDSRAGEWGALDADCAPPAHLNIITPGDAAPGQTSIAAGAAPGTDANTLSPSSLPPSNLPPSNLPLGIAREIDYEQFYRRLDRHDLLLLYTDSATEARSPAGAELGEDGLLDLVRTLDPTRPEALVSGIVAALRAHTQRDEPADDLTLLLLGHNDVRPRTGPRAFIEASGRVAKEVATSIGRKPVPWPDWRLETFGGIMSKRLNERWGGKAED